MFVLYEYKEHNLAELIGIYSNQEYLKQAIDFNISNEYNDKVSNVLFYEGRSENDVDRITNFLCKYICYVPPSVSKKIMLDLKENLFDFPSPKYWNKNLIGLEIQSTEPELVRFWGQDFYI